MMLKRYVSAAMAGLLMAAVPVAAQDDALGCMAANYSAEEQAQFKTLGSQARFDGGAGNAAADQLGEIAMNGVFDCAVERGWNDDQIVLASLYEISRISEQAFRSSAMLTAQQLSRFDAALATGDRRELWAAVSRSVNAGMDDSAPGASVADDEVMGNFAIEVAGSQAGTQAEMIGVLLAFMSMQRTSLRDFAATGRGKQDK